MSSSVQLPAGLTRRAPARPARGVPRRQAVRLGRLLRQGRLVSGASLLLVFLALAAFPSQIAPWDPSYQELSRRLQPPAWISGDPTYPLGGDQLGRDLWSRLVYGARVSLLFGGAAVAASAAVGVALGLLAGYFGDPLDSALMAVAEVQLAFPFVLLAITIVAITSPSTPTLVLVLALSAWVIYARLIRARVLAVREQEFVEAARALGAGTARVVLRHVLPQLIGTIAVVATLELGRIIVLESTLSFLGLGVQPPEISWGQVLADGRQYIANGWWVSAFSGLAITLVVLAVNTLGDWLAEALDPNMSRS